MNKESKFYYRDGTTSNLYRYRGRILHRVDGPAVEYTNGSREWRVDGKLHRIGGPAIEYTGVGEWWVDGKMHRTDGPAVEYTGGSKEWWIDHERYTEYDFNKLIKEINEMSLVMKLTDPRWWVRELGEKEVG
jgi:hypothetical protein